MPYVVIKKNGKGVNAPFVFTQDEVDNLAADQENCYVLVNTTTRRLTKVGCKRKKKVR